MREIKHLMGLRIRELRIERGLSQEALADRAGLHRNYIGAVERGEINCTIPSLMTIAEALRVDLSQLIVLEESEEDARRLRESVLQEISESPAEVVRLVSHLLTDLKALKIKPKPGKKGSTLR